MSQAEKDLKVMWNICRDFFYKWRSVVEEEFGREKARDLVKKFWEKVGEGTAKLYKEHGVNPENLVEIAKAIARSSEIMGEKVEVLAEEDKVIVRHTSCPWFDWAKMFGLEEEDKEGCDIWFKVTVEKMNPRAKVETTKSFAAGDDFCERIIYFE